MTRPLDFLSTVCSDGRTIASDLALIIVGFPKTTAEFTGRQPLRRPCPKVEGDLERFSGKEGRRKKAKAEGVKKNT